MVTVIIPAHDEAQVIGRLLRKIVLSSHPGEFDIIVVANGCTDNTADIASGINPAIRVVSIPVASKHAALAEGNRLATSFPRLYVDADVELSGSDLRVLAEALQQPGTLCAAPQRAFDMAGRPFGVRWYYEIWTRLPEVRRGVFGRGVFGVSAEGYDRLRNLPRLMADDLAASLAFATSERMIVSGTRVLIHPPRTYTDLLRARTRAVMGADQVEEAATSGDASARTQPSHIVSIVSRAPYLAPQAALFLYIALLARRRARRLVAAQGYTTWLRDESSRDVTVPAARSSRENELTGSA